ncbi:4Fe-4S double cluster binding domain-containing protein, partial [uncultured Duncaniella sp.]
LSEHEFEPDPLLAPICNNCNLCADVCPINALSESELKQLDCWNHAFGDDEEQKTWKISCHKCRDICPYNLGSKNKL